MLLFESDGCRLSMTRENFAVVGQYKQILADTVQELLMITAREVCPTDTAVEKNVTTN